MPLSETYNEDCIAGMKRYPDKYFDLSIVDPPYGINYGKLLKGKGDGNGGMDKNGWKSYGEFKWDEAIPTAEYWSELFRVSKNQIVWGGNYFTEHLPPSMGWIM
jgi:site-specific DNA-methyltransferase (adenine-specific)